jgi:hypothetical protein
LTEALRVCVKARLRLDYPDAEGHTFRSSLEAVAQRTGKRPIDLEEPDVPLGCEQLLDDFWHLKARGGERISYTELDAFCRLTGRTLPAWQVNTLMQLDNEYASFVSERQRTARR